VPYNSVEDWDSVPGEPGNQPLYVEAPDGQVRAGSPYACEYTNGCDGTRTCVGGKNAGEDCTEGGANVCQGGVCVGVDAWVENITIESAKNSIQALFAKSMGIWVFDNSNYVEKSNDNIPASSPSEKYKWDITHDLAGTKTKPPTVSDMSINQTNGDKSLPVILKFYAYADDNHMPLKKITIDWGDGQSIVSGGPGSYYQNRKIECNDTSKDKIKRCDDGAECESSCGDNSICRARFGDSKEACEARPFEFSHVYSCNQDIIRSLPSCKFVEGNVTNSPCGYYTRCYFRPKVQVLDNWGWCNGTCDNPNNLDGVGCYDGSNRVPIWADECDPEDDYYSHWTEFGGNIIVTP